MEGDFVDSKGLFDFRSKSVLSYFRAPPVDQYIIPDDLIKGTYKDVSFPVIFKQSGGKKICDLIAIENPKLFLISEQFKTILDKNRITGWVTYPIKLFDKEGNEIFGYYGFSVIGRCGELNFKNCELVEKKLVPHGPLCQFYKGVKIDFWDGSDFCLPKNSTQIIVSPKTAELLKQSKLSNVQLENLAERETSIRLV